MVKFNFLSILITIGIIGMGIFVWQMLIPFIQVNTERQDVQAFDDRFFGFGDSKTIVVNFTSLTGESLDSDADVMKAETAISGCQFSYIDMLYPRGRMNIAIDDETQDNTCSSAIRFYKDNTIRTLDCRVPSETMTSWSTWKNRDFPSTAEIDPHCRELSSFEVSEDLLEGG